MPALQLNERRRALAGSPLRLLSRDEFSRQARQVLGDAPLGQEGRESPPASIGLARLLLFRLVIGDRHPPALDQLAAIDCVDQAYHLYASHLASSAGESTAAFEEPRPGVDRDLFGGEHVVLRPLAPTHLDWLVAVLSHPEVIQRPPVRGVPPSPHTLLAQLDERLLCQFVVGASDGTPLGLVRALDADLHNRHAHLELVFPPTAVLGGWPLEGAVRFVEYCFRTFGLRKLYLEVDADVHRQLPLAARELLSVEGVLRDHREHLGTWVDVTRTCIWRDDWLEQRGRWLASAA